MHSGGKGNSRNKSKETCFLGRWEKGDGSSHYAVTAHSASRKPIYFKNNLFSF